METSIMEWSPQALRILIGSFDNLFWLAVENETNTNYVYCKSSLWSTCGKDQRMRIWKTKQKQQKQQKSELVSSSEFYFLKNHLKNWCIYTNDALFEENILENAYLKLPSEPVCKLLKKSTNCSCPFPTLSLTLTIYLSESEDLIPVALSNPAFKKGHFFPPPVIPFMRNRLYLWRQGQKRTWKNIWTREAPYTLCY